MNANLKVGNLRLSDEVTRGAVISKVLTGPSSGTSQTVGQAIATNDDGSPAIAVYVSGARLIPALVASGSTPTDPSTVNVLIAASETTLYFEADIVPDDGEEFIVDFVKA